MCRPSYNLWHIFRVKIVNCNTCIWTNQTRPSVSALESISFYKMRTRAHQSGGWRFFVVVGFFCVSVWLTKEIGSNWMDIYTQCHHWALTRFVIESTSSVSIYQIHDVYSFCFCPLFSFLFFSFMNLDKYTRQAP